MEFVTIKGRIPPLRDFKPKCTGYIIESLFIGPSDFSSASLTPLLQWRLRGPGTGTR